MQSLPRNDLLVITKFGFLQGDTHGGDRKTLCLDVSMVLLLRVVEGVVVTCLCVQDLLS